jgi:hypothetical protein
LSYTLQSACSFSLDRNNELVREERNQSNEYEQSGKSGESTKCTCDPGSNASCTCTGATSGTTSSRGTATTGHTSFPCAHCRDNDSSTNGLVRKHKYTSISATTLSSAADYIERDYAEYIAATSAQGQGASTRIRDSDESGNIKQTDADSSDSVERRIGIPAGVTI